MMSTNNGTTWNIISRNPITHYISNSDCFYNFPIEGWGWWKHEFEVSNTNINTFYLGGNTMYKSTNAGVTWSSISQYSPTISPTLPAINTTHADIRALLQLTSLTGDYLIIGNDGGIAKTTNGGALWTNINGSGLLITQFYSFGSFISNKNLVGGTQDNGTKFKNGSTNLWSSSVLGGDGGWTEVNYANDNIVYASVYDYIYKSTTGGESGYSSISNPGGSYTLGRRFHVDASNPNKLWWGYKNLYVYDEPTNIWSLKFSAPPPLNNFTDISAIKVAPSNGNIIYVAYWGPTWGKPRLNKLLKTTNGGTTWTDISNNFSAYDWTYISDFEIDPYNPNRVWASCAGYWPGSPPNEGQGANRVVFSNDGGLTWNDNSIGLPPIPVNCLVYQNGTDDVIYSGTDAGVYRWNKTIQTWECFNNGFPASIITKLVIDNCKNKILASTFGRGIWEAPLPNTAEYHITTSQTWDALYNRSFNNDVIVDYGVAFTIKGTINFAGNKKLVIMPNAKVIIDGGKITNGCGAQWQGIEVWGTTTQHQSTNNGVCYQGTVELKNGAVIENAYNGITNWKPDDWNSIGGIIIASNATFRNNRRSVEFMSYRNFDPATGNEVDNLSNFSNCTFEVNDAYPSVASPFAKMVSLWKVKGVTFAGCDFLNNRTNNFTGQAIGSLDAGYKVLALAGTPVDRSFFKNFAYGIQASNSQTVNSIYVDNAKFTSNGYGIDLTAINGAVIVNSLFEIGTAPNCPNQGFGIATNTCSGYAIEQNTFMGGTSVPGTSFTGISITNSGQTYNEVYKNTFQNVTYGNSANLQNALSYPLYGLTYLCNTNAGNKYDFYVTSNPASMISPYQRSGSSIAT